MIGLGASHIQLHKAGFLIRILGPINRDVGGMYRKRASRAKESGASGGGLLPSGDARL